MHNSQTKWYRTKPTIVPTIFKNIVMALTRLNANTFCNSKLTHTTNVIWHKKTSAPSQKGQCPLTKFTDRSIVA